MPCDNWQSLSTHHGSCNLNLYGGKPSLGVCRQCTANTESGTWPIATAPQPIPESVEVEFGLAIAGPDMLGDRIASLCKKWGIDRVAKEFERVTGIPCGCSGRRAMLNKAGDYLRSLLHRKSS